jgi:hypothetical protein
MGLKNFVKETPTAIQQSVNDLKSQGPVTMGIKAIERGWARGMSALKSLGNDFSMLR